MWKRVVGSGLALLVVTTLQWRGSGGETTTTTATPTPQRPSQTTTTTAELSPHSCAKIGCGAHEEGKGGCYCTESCTQYDNCCEDYQAQCVTTTTPEGPTTSPRPMTCSEKFEVKVLSYNLFWWNVVGKGGRGGMPAVHSRLNEFGPFDFMGFQECEGVDQTVDGIDQKNVGRTQLVVEPAGKTGKDVCVAWDASKMTKVSEGSAKVGHDGFSDRWMLFVRLSHNPSGRTFFFATAHGAIQQCEAASGGAQVAKNYLNAIHSNRKDDDIVILTGDFNCGRDSLALKTIAQEFPNAGYASKFPPVLIYPDNIFIGPTDQIQAKEWKTFPLNPSDHNGLYGTYTVCKSPATIEV